MSGDSARAGPTSVVAWLSAFPRELPARWRAVLVHPGVRTLREQRAAARWSPVWAGLAVQAVAQGAAVWLVLAGLAGRVGISSLPFRPKLGVPAALLAK